MIQFIEHLSEDGITRMLMELALPSENLAEIVKYARKVSAEHPAIADTPHFISISDANGIQQWLGTGGGAPGTGGRHKN